MSLTVDQVIAAAVEGALDTTSARQSAFFEIVGDRVALKCEKGVSRLIKEFVDQGGPIEDWPVVAAGRDRAPMLLATPQELRARFPASAPLAEAAGLKAVANLPVIVGDRVVGVLHLGFDAPHEFPSEEREFLLALSQLVAQSLEQAGILERVSRITQSLAEAESDDAVARLIYSEAVAILRADRVTLRLRDPATGELVLTGDPVGVSQALRVGPQVQSLSTEAFRSGKPVAVTSSDEYRRRYPEFAASLQAVPDAALSVPLRLRGRSTGALSFSFTESRRFADREIGLAQLLADAAAAALERLRLADLQKRTADRQASIARIARHALEADSQESLAGKVMEELVQEEDCRTCAIFLHDEGNPVARLLAQFGWRPPVIERFHSTPVSAQSAIGAALTHGEPVYVEDAAEYGRRFPQQRDVYAGEGLEASCALPLLSHGRTVGALTVAFGDAREFDPATRAFMETIAATTAQGLERLRAQQAEHRLRDLLEAVVTQMPVGIRILSPDGRVITSNPLAVAPWRGDREIRSVSDYSSWPTFHPDGRPYESAERPAVRALGGETVVDEEVVIQRFDGTRAVLSVSAAPVRDANGDIVAGVVVSQDVTERTDRQFGRDAFLAVLSHELRTPMTSIAAAARLLQAKSSLLDRETIAGLYDDIAAETARLNRIIENLLVLSRVEQSMVRAAGEPVMLDRFLQRVIRAEQSLWPASRITLDCQERLPVVHGDPSFLEQVMRNLLSNAAKYAPGEVEIRVRHETASPEVRIWVRDHGPGVTPEDAENLFKLFWRAPDLVGRAPGAGVGLFVVRKLVEAMEGRVWLDSSVSDGACFVVALQLVDEAAEPA